MISLGEIAILKILVSKTENRLKGIFVPVSKTENRLKEILVLVS